MTPFEWGILLSLAGALVLLAWILFQQSPRLRVSERGIHDPSLKLGWIRWEEIEGAYHPGRDDSDGLFVKLRVSDRIDRRLRKRLPEVIDLSDDSSLIDVRVDLHGTDLSPTELLQTILDHSAPTARRPLPG